MDQQAALSPDALRAGLAFIRQVEDLYPVQVAFWINRINTHRFWLCLASDQLTPSNHSDLRFQVFKAAVNFGSLSLDPMAINLVGMDDPLTLRALEIRRGRPGIAVSNYNSERIGGEYIESFYVYSERHLQRFVMN